MKKLLSMLLLAVTTVAMGFSEVYKVEDLITPEQLAELKKNGSIFYEHEEKDNSLALLPKTCFDEKVKNLMVPKKPRATPYIGEYLYLIPKSDLIDGVTKTNVTVEDMERVVRSISKMEGMRYHFDDKYPLGEDVLYEHCYRISDPSSKDPLPDELEGDINGYQAYCFQDDHTFGDTRYQLNYYKENGVLLCTFLNKKPLGIWGIYPLKNDNMRINILTVDCGDSLLLYISCDVNCNRVLIFSVRGKVKESLNDRMLAVYKWFLYQFK